jgi:nucleoid DNA-binding protein
MNTTEVIITLARKLGISQAAARKILNQRLKDFSQQLLKDNNVDLPGLGKIETHHTKARRQYIPSKQCLCLVPSHKRTAFKINTLFKARLKRNGP